MSCYADTGDDGTHQNDGERGNDDDDTELNSGNGRKSVNEQANSVFLQASGESSHRSSRLDTVIERILQMKSGKSK